MKKLIAVLLALTLFAQPVLAANKFDSYNEREWLRCTTMEINNAVAVTDTNTNVAFNRDAKAIYVENIGANELYLDVSDGIAVASATGGILIPAGDNRSISSFQTRSIGLITSAAETTTAFVEVCY